jgi:uncharacterized membrane protein
VTSLAALAQRVERLDSLDAPVRAGRRFVDTVAGPKVKQVLGGEWLGHPVHPALTDLPIGFWTSAFVLDLFGGPTSRTAARQLVALGVLSVPLTAVTGASDWSSSDDPRFQRAGLVHAASNVAATLAYVRSWTQRRAGRHTSGIAWGVVGATLATLGGYLGGHLAFGIGEPDAGSGPNV